MTEPAAPIPAAWYPDPSGSPRQRWWDGTQWTENYSEPQMATVPYSTTVAPDAAAPAGLKVYTPWVWIILGLLVLSLISLLTFNFADYMAAILLNPNNPFAMFTPAYLFLAAAGFVTYWGAVAFAYFDHRDLTRAGVQRPFHWAFAFISALVYLIGRAVVLKRRVGAGSVTLWAAIAYIVLSIVVSVIWIMNAFAYMMQFAQYSNFS